MPLSLSPLSLPKISPAKLSLVIYWLHPKVMKVVPFHLGLGLLFQKPLKSPSFVQKHLLYIHTYIHTYMHTYIYIYMHTYM